MVGFGNIGGIGGNIRIGRGAHQMMPRAKRADQDGVVLVFGGKTQIVGEGRRDVQVEAAAAGLLAQEVGLHMHIAIAEQDEVEPWSLPIEIPQALGRARRPVGIGAPLGFTAKALDQSRRVAAVAGRQDGGDVGQFGFGILLRQDPLENQRGQAVDQFPLRQAGQLHQGGKVGGQLARRRAKADDLGDRRIDDRAQVADRVDQQGASVVEGNIVQELGATQLHRLLFLPGPIRPVRPRFVRLRRGRGGGNPHFRRVSARNGGS